MKPAVEFKKHNTTFNTTYYKIRRTIWDPNDWEIVSKTELINGLQLLAKLDILVLNLDSNATNQTFINQYKKNKK